MPQTYENKLEREGKETLLNSEADIKLKEDEMTEAVKGCKDFLGEDARKRELIKDILIKKFKLYGFEPAETPIIEYEEFVKGQNQNDEAVSDIFKLSDRGERKLALRYEFTFQLKRISQNQKLPYKRYQIGEVFRDEPTSSNRFRQFTQCDIDIVGSTIKDDAEILAMASSLLKELGIKATINFNNRKLLNEILDKEGIKNKEQVIKEIDKLDKLTEKEVKENLKKYKAEKLVQIFKKPEFYFERYDTYKEIKELKDYCKEYNITVNFLPSLARGLSYYNGTVFEIKTQDVKESITGGGSYLVNGIQSTGISFGLERLSSLAKIDASEKRILIISIGQDEKSIKLSENLRKNNIPCTIMYNKVSKALEFANSYALPYVIFLGEEEAKKKKVKLRDMKSGKEEMMKETELLGLFKKLS
jgi:histidyl-tRNA synthetase